MLSARIMILSIIPYIIAQLPSIFNFSATGNIPVLVACIVSLAGLVAYCLYQVCSISPLISFFKKRNRFYYIIAKNNTKSLKRCKREAIAGEYTHLGLPLLV